MKWNEKRSQDKKDYLCNFSCVFYTFHVFFTLFCVYKYNFNLFEKKFVKRTFIVLFKM